MFGVVGLVERVEKRDGTQGPYARLKVSLEGGAERRVFFAATDEPEEESTPCLMQFVERGIVRDGSRLLFHHLPDDNEWFRWRGYKDRYGLWKRGPGVSLNTERLVSVYDAIPFCQLKGFVTGRLGIEEVTTERSTMGIVRHRILQRHWRLLWGELSGGQPPQDALRAARRGTEDFIDVLSRELKLPDLSREATATLRTCEDISNEIMEWTGPSGYFCSEYNVMSNRLGLVGRPDFVGLRLEGGRDGRIIEYKITDQAKKFESKRSWGTVRALVQAATYSKMFQEAVKVPQVGSEVWVFDKWSGERASQHECDSGESEDYLRRCLWGRDEYLYSVSSPSPPLGSYGKNKCRSCSLNEVCKGLLDYAPDPALSRIRDGLDQEAEASWRSLEPLDDLFEDGFVVPDNPILGYSEDDLTVRLQGGDRGTPARVGSFVRFSPRESTHGWGFGVVRGVEGDVLDIRLRDPLTPSLLKEGKLRLDFSVPVDFSRRAKMALTATEVPGALTGDQDMVAHLTDLKRAVECASSVVSSKTGEGISGLNESQQSAVQTIMESKLAVIHGPFGSGKTTVIARASLELARLGKRVLVTSYTNNAVDNAMAMIADLAREEGVALRQVRVVTEGKAQKAEDIQVVDPRHFGKEDISRMREADVVGSTLISCLSNAFRDAYMEKAGYVRLRDLPFEVCIVDEASQCVLPYALIPCLMSKRWVLVGDHKQLEPLVMDARAVDSLTSWFDLAARDLEEEGGIVMLDVQYRCPHEVGSYLSRQFYDSKLKNDGSEGGHDHPTIDLDLEAGCGEVNARLKSTGIEARLTPDGLSAVLDPSNHLIFLDTDGRSPERGRRSKSNTGEAIVASQVIRMLGQATDDLLFLSPYQAQNSVVRGLVEADIRMGTVDSYQGRQSDVVVLSLVRSNSSGILGFLRNVRRLNVAMSRCMKKLIVISDSATIRMNRADLQAREVLMDYIRAAKDLGSYVTLAPERKSHLRREPRRELALKPSLRGRRPLPSGTTSPPETSNPADDR
jgi:RecA/RadA recombinase